MQIKNILEKVRSELKHLYNDNLVNIVLYGSYARNDYNENSDIDLLVILKKVESTGKEIDRIVDVIFDINLEYNVLISVVPISEVDYKMINSPLLLNVRKEGVLVG
jgi:predicted nucleotidyltransferase